MEQPLEMHHPISGDPTQKDTNNNNETRQIKQKTTQIEFFFFNKNDIKKEKK